MRRQKDIHHATVVTDGCEERMREETAALNKIPSQ